MLLSHYEDRDDTMEISNKGKEGGVIWSLEFSLMCYTPWVFEG